MYANHLLMAEADVLRPQLDIHCLRNDRHGQSSSTEADENVFHLENFHEQLPLPVPCYDLLPVIELTLGRHAADFGYSQLP